MTVQSISYSTTLVGMTCGVCHIPFGLPSNLYQSAKDDGRWFYCPNGDKIHFYETETKRLRQETERLVHQRDAARVARDAARDQAEAAERRRRAAKGQLTKVKKRVAAGVCPCCNRTFQNLADHMSGQHPDYAEPTP